MRTGGAAVRIRKRNDKSGVGAEEKEPPNMASKKFDPKEVAETAEALRSIRSKSTITDTGKVYKAYKDGGLKAVVSYAKSYGKDGGKITRSVLEGVADLAELVGDADSAAVFNTLKEHMPTFGAGGGGRGRVSTRPKDIGEEGTVGVAWRPKNPKKPETGKIPNVVVPLEPYIERWDLVEPTKEDGSQRARSSQSLKVRFEKDQIIISVR